MTEIAEFRDACIFITGACGTVGRELTRQVVAAGAARVLCVDNNETDQFFLQDMYKNVPQVECYLVDIRDDNELKRRMKGVDIVLHAAALKHVGLCEDSPSQAVQTNINGVQNIIDAAVEAGVSRVIFTSSDKAVNPTNVMGTTKLMGERLMTAANQNYADADTIFASTRFGNVLGSRGSVVPLFERQIAAGGPVTLTDRRMTRFIMTLEEAVELVLRSVFMATGGEVFVTKMPVARIADIAEIMVAASSGGNKIEIREIGIKPGEKLYEELTNEEEIRRTFEAEDFLIVLPAFGDHNARALSQSLPQINRVYNSSIEPAMSASDLRDYLFSRKIITLSS